MCSKRNNVRASQKKTLSGRLKFCDRSRDDPEGVVVGKSLLQGKPHS